MLFFRRDRTLAYCGYWNCTAFKAPGKSHCEEHAREQEEQAAWLEAERVKRLGNDQDIQL